MTEGCALEAVLFRVGGLRCALEAARVAALRPAGDDPQALAVEGLLGLPATADTPRRHLLLHRPGGTVAVAVEEPVELRPLPCTAIHPLPPLLAARTALPALRGLYLDGEGVVLLLDAATLLRGAPAGSADNHGGRCIP